MSNNCLVDRGALKMALNVLRRAGKDEVADELEASVNQYENIDDPWHRAIDLALLTAHLGIYQSTDTVQDAQRKLNELIDWHVAVATDPATNGGMVLVKQFAEGYAAGHQDATEAFEEELRSQDRPRDD